MSRQVLLVECADKPGLVHGITGVLLRYGVNVVGNQEFVDVTSARFFMRTEFEGTVDGAALEADVRSVLPENAEVRYSDLTPKRVVVLGSKEHHCLGDILLRHAFGELNARVLGVICNHPTLGVLVEKFGMPFHWISHEGESRESHEEALLKAIEAYEPDYVVLAKYMRILSPEFVRRFPARVINIHHAFRPAFVGARPYHQAFTRGVKVIGATAHFVTDALDQGPIIVQQVMPVDHTHSPEDMSQAGHDVEQLVLAKALKLVFEDRVFLCGNRTVIFD